MPCQCRLMTSCFILKIQLFSCLRLVTLVSFWCLPPVWLFPQSWLFTPVPCYLVCLSYCPAGSLCQWVSTSSLSLQSTLLTVLFCCFSTLLGAQLTLKFSFMLCTILKVVEFIFHLMGDLSEKKKSTCGWLFPQCLMFLLKTTHFNCFRVVHFKVCFTSCEAPRNYNKLGNKKCFVFKEDKNNFEFWLQTLTKFWGIKWYNK